MSRLALVCLLALVVLPLPAAAQSDPANPCSPEEIALVLEVTEEWNVFYTSLARAMLAPRPDMDRIVRDAHYAQTWWWTDYALRLPDCGPTPQLILLAGRLADETMISVLLVESGRHALADEHLAAMQEIGAAFGDLAAAFVSP